MDPRLPRGVGTTSGLPGEKNISPRCTNPGSAGAGSAADPTQLSVAFIKRAETHPLHLARSLLACFQSWASAGFLQDDFYAPQFTLSDDGAIFLVDGPDDFLLSSPLGNSVVRAWGTKNESEPCLSLIHI